MVVVTRRHRGAAALQSGMSVGCTLKSGLSAVNGGRVRTILREWTLHQSERERGEREGPKGGEDDPSPNLPPIDVRWEHSTKLLPQAFLR